MKRVIYYVSVFVTYPVILLVFALLDKSPELRWEIYPFICIGVFYLVSALLGSLSPTSRNFDYILPVIILISFFCSLFIGLYFDEGCDGKPQLSIYHALNMAYYEAWLPHVVVMGIIAFTASFEPIRMMRKLIDGYRRR